MRPESTNAGHRVSWPVLAALILVPLLAVGSLLGLTRAQGAQPVNAAIVNLDEMVEINGQPVPMGRQLAAAIMDREGDNITWTLADAKNAKDGLASGQYAAVITIPKSFSAAATSFSANDADKARQATVQVQVSENAPVTDAALAEQVARLAADTLNSTLTETYLDNVYVGFNSVKEQFTTIVDGAQQLSDGASQLADGTGQTSDGAAQLADGMKQLAGGASQLSTGVGTLQAESGKLVDGISQLAGGAEQLLEPLPAYAQGVKQSLGGVTQIKGGIDQVIAEIKGASTDTSALQPLVEGAGQLADGAEGLSAGLEQVDQTLKAFASGQAPRPEQVTPPTADIVAAIAPQFQCPVADPQTCGMLQQTFEAGVAAGAQGGFQAGFQAGTGTASAMLNTDGPTGATLIEGAGRLATGTRTFSDQVAGLPTQLQRQAAAQTGELVAGLQQISDGAGTLITKSQPLVDNADSIGSGATQLLGGIQQLNSQVGALPAGIAKLADGASQLSNGTSQLADGAGKLSAGIVQLDEGAEQLAEGTDTFATKLAEGAEQVPTYSAEQRKALSAVVASPIEKSDDVVANPAAPLTALLLVAGLWLGALAAFVVSRPVPSDVVASGASSATLWARTLALPAGIAAAQGVVFGFIGAWVLELPFGRTLGLVALLASLGVAFVLANHALAAWLGNIGRGISVVLLTVTLALGLTSTAPAWLGALASASPVHNALLLVRAWVSSGSGLAALVGGAILIGSIALVASYAAIAARRQVKASDFRRRMVTAA